jgi:hypothetical protein
MKNIKFRKDRKLDISKPVRVYWNLHKGGFSVKQNNLVIAHVVDGEVSMKHSRFLVMEKGRERVLKEKRKNVHAFVEGFILPSLKIDHEGKQVTYNPYKNNQFVCEGEDVRFAQYVDLRVVQRDKKRVPMIKAYKPEK